MSGRSDSRGYGGADAPHLDATAQAVLSAARRMEDATDALLAHRDGGAPA